MKMNKYTRKAWEECKIHWDKIANCDPDETVGADTCAFCQRFDTTRCRTSDTGEPCPVYRATGCTGCAGTPYGRAAYEHTEQGSYGPTEYREAERDFIYSLGEAEDVLTVGEYDYE